MRSAQGELYEIISTPRLVLRSTTAHDVPALHERVFSDPEVVRYVFRGIAFSPAESKRFVADRFKVDGDGVGLATLVERKSSEVIGFSGLIPCRALGEEDLELGFVLGKAYWGKGYATEIERGQIAFGFSTLQRRRLLALVDPANTASIRALEKLGMRHEGNVPVEGRGERRVYRINKDLPK